jgi:hypothetical protein
MAAALPNCHSLCFFFGCEKGIGNISGTKYIPLFEMKKTFCLTQGRNHA